MKKENGFTLAELLAVITILGVIALIVFPAVNKAIKNSKEKSYNQQVESILDSAENWTTENMSQLSDTSDNYLTIGELQQSGYLEAKKVINPITDEEMNGCIVIKYDTNYNQYTYRYEEESCDELEPKIYTFQEIMENSDEVYNNDPDSNLRYVGSDPDNYVWFNNELWRIIGLFDGQPKIIRNDNYSTSLAWDTNGGTDWSNASLKNELNETFLSGIETISKSYINQEYTWKLGQTPNTPDYWTRSAIYGYERNTETTWTGAIGLMYISDYGYAADPTSTNCDTSLCEYACSSWLDTVEYSQWTLTIGNSISVFILPINTISSRMTCSFLDTMVTYATGYATRPTLFLKTEVVIIDGTGTSEDPYILDM